MSLPNRYFRTLSLNLPENEMNFCEPPQKKISIEISRDISDVLPKDKCDPTSNVSSISNSYNLRHKFSLKEFRQGLSKAIHAYSTEIIQQIETFEVQCNFMTEDLNFVKHKVGVLSTSCNELKLRLPDLSPKATTLESKALLKSSRAQRLPPHLVNRMMTNQSLPGYPSKLLQTACNPSNKSLFKLPVHPAPRTIKSSSPPPSPSPAREEENHVKALEPEYQPERSLPVEGLPIHLLTAAPLPFYSTAQTNLFDPPIQPCLSLDVTSADEGICLNWNLAETALVDSHFEPASCYELFSYAAPDSEPSCIRTSDAWQKVADVTAFPLPMTCTLASVVSNSMYYFAMRSVDRFQRRSDWSNVINAYVC